MVTQEKGVDPRVKRTRQLLQQTFFELLLETIALVMSWAIFGAAVQWSHGERTISAEQMADYVLAVISEGVVRLTPDPKSP